MTKMKMLSRCHLTSWSGSGVSLCCVGNALGLCREKFPVSEKSLVPSRSLAVDSGMKLRPFLRLLYALYEEFVPTIQDNQKLTKLKTKDSYITARFQLTSSKVGVVIPFLFARYSLNCFAENRHKTFFKCVKADLKNISFLNSIFRLGYSFA